MMRYLRFCLKTVFLFSSFCMFGFFSSYSKVIITHGACAKSEAWYQPGGYFYEAVAEDASKLGLDVVSFSWDQDLGGITHAERIKAGMNLAKQIIDLNAQGENEIILIGHSYGGHVIKMASQLLAFALIDIEEIDESEQNVDEEIEEIEDALEFSGDAQETEIPVLDDEIFESEEELLGSEEVIIEPESEIVEEVVSEEMEEDDAVVLTAELELFEEIEKRTLEFLEADELFEDACKQVQKYKKEKLTNKTSEKEFLIDIVYTLGTPNDIPDYVADMNVIGYLFNLYSHGDLLQDILGDKLLPEPKHVRSVNLYVQIKGSGWFGLWGFPKSSEMHSAIIGKWILDLPFNFMNNKIGNFESFVFEKNGKISFTENKPPIYEVDTSGLAYTSIFGKYDLSWLCNKFKFLGSLC